MAKVKLKETTIFPLPCEKGHSFIQLNDNAEPEHIRGFYKEDAKGNRITNTVYGILFCTKCGETKEIAIVNRRR